MLRSIALLVGAILIPTAACLGQQRVGEAVFFDEKDKVYKVERKYAGTDGTMYYVKHVDEGSMGIRKREYRRGDTAIVEIEYCDFKIKLNSIQQRGRAEKMLHTRELSFDSMKLWEMRKCYYRKGYPVKMEVFGRQKNLEGRVLFNYGKRNVVCKRYRTGKGATSKPYATDNISWNLDTTVIDCRLVYKEDSFKMRLTLEQSTLTSYTGKSGAEYAEWSFTEKRSVKGVIINRSIFDDLPFGMELYLLERERMVSAKDADGNEVKDEYKLDDTGGLVSKIRYKNGVHDGRATFRWW